MYPLVAVAQGGAEPTGTSSSGATGAAGAPICEAAKVVEFKGNSTVLSPDAKMTLDQIAMSAKDQRTSVRLKGSSARKGRAAKAKIAERRAEAVKGYLAESGVDPALITATPLDPQSAPVPMANAVEVVTCAQPVAQQPQTPPDRSVMVLPAPSPTPAAGAESQPPGALGAQGEGTAGQPGQAGQTGPMGSPDQTAQAPMTAAPWEATTDTQPRFSASPVRSRIGVEAMLGGGVTGFVDEQARNFTDPGGSWEARLSVGTRLPVSVEAAYVGSAQNIEALGLSDDAVLVGSAAEATARVNFTRQLKVQPYIFGGVGWQHYEMTNEGANTSALTADDDLFTIPAGVGISFRLLKGLVLDVRGTFRTAFDEELMNAPYAATGQDAKLHTWDAGARIGWEF